MIKTLLWAEWRQKRFVFLAMVILFGGIWLLTWLSACIFPENQIKDAYHNVIGLLVLLYFLLVPILALYDLSIGSASSKNVNSFLFGMPVSPGKIFWTKFLAGQTFIAFFYVSNLALIYVWEIVWGLDNTIKVMSLFSPGLLIIPMGWIFFGMSQTPKTKTKAYVLFIFSLYYSVITMFVVFYVLTNGLLKSVFPHIISSGILSLVVVSLYGLFRIRHTWEIGVARDMPVIRVNLQEALRLVLISTSLFVLIWGYTWIRYKSAREQAIEAGIIPTTYNKIIPANQNGAKSLIRFNKLWAPLWKNSIRSKAYRIIHKWKAPLNDNQKEIIDQMASKRLLNACVFLNQALEAPHIQIIPTTNNNYNNGWKEFFNAAFFLEIKAICAEYQHNTKVLFSTIDNMIKLAEIVPDATPNISNGLFYTRACRIAFWLGPETKKNIGFYRKLLNETEGARIIDLDDEYNILDMMISTKIPWKSLPIYLENQSTVLHQHIAAKKLIAQASNGFPSVYKKAKEIFAPTLTRYKFESSPIYRYFRYQSRLNSDRITLALKIYRIKHGNYPDSLKKLSPDILKKIPIDVFNGKPFQYRQTNDGFILSAGKDIIITYPANTNNPGGNNNAK